MAVIRLMTCNSAFEANLIKTRLIDEDIECFLTNENFTTLLPGTNGMLGAGVQVMIDEKDKERANAIIKPENSTITKCPNCGSENIVLGLGKKKVSKILFIFISVISTMPFNNIKRTYYCKDCKTDFKY